MTRRSLALALAALALAACRDPAPAPPTADAGAAQAPAIPAAPTERRDPGPLLTRRIDALPPLDHPPMTLEVDAVETVDGAVYVRALVPRDTHDLAVGDPLAARIEVLGERYGLAVPAGEGRVPDRPWIYVRLTGEAPPPDPLTVRWRQPALYEGEPGRIQDLHLVGAATAPQFPRLAPRVLGAMARWFADRGEFGAFAAGRLSALAGAGVGRSRRVEALDLLDLYTAPYAPALMFDRGQRSPAGGGAPQPVSAMKPADEVGHPWRSLAEGLAASPDEPFAAWAPEEWIYLGIRNPAAALAAFESMAALFGPPLAALSGSPGSSRPIERALTRLGLEAHAVVQIDRSLGRGALLLTDPWIHETPGVALLATITDPQKLDAGLAERDAVVKADGATAEPIEIRGRAGVRLATADGAVSAHRVVTDGVLIIANSAAVLDRVLAARDGERPLSATGDLEVLRGMVPPAPPHEAVFAVVSEPCIARLTDPVVRTLAARRTRAMADLRAVGFAGLLYGWLEGRPLDLARPAELATLRASGLLTDADLRHDDGSPITVDGGRACSARWGCAGHGRPLIELSLDAVTQAEVGAWDRLRADLLGAFRERVAPMALRIRQSPHGYDLEARMMPLARRHAYGDLEALIGGLTVEPLGDGPGAELRLAIAPDAPQRAEIGEWLREVTTQRSVDLGWLGSQITVGLADRASLWDGVLALTELPNRDGRRIWRDPARRKQIIDRLPAWMVARVDDRAAFRQAMTAVKVFAEASGDVVRWQPAPTYRGVETVEVRETLSEETESRVGLYYAVTGQTLVVALERAVFEETLDRVLDGVAGPKIPGFLGAADGGARVALRFGREGWLRRALAGLIERMAVTRLRPARQAFEAAARGMALPPPGPARDAALIDALGLRPEGPHGDPVGLDEAGLPTLPRYGTALAPVWPKLPVEGERLSTVRAIDAALRFEGEPGRSSMVVELRWR